MENKRKRLLLLSVRIGIAAILIVFLIRLARVEAIFNSLSRITFPSLSFAVFLLYTSILLGAFNQYFLFQPILKISFKKFTRSYFKAYIAGLFFPSQVGDASIIFFLRNSGLRYSQSFSIYIWDKYITLLIYAGIVLLFLFDMASYPVFYIPIILILFFSISAGMLYFLSKLGHFLPFEGWLGRLSALLKNITSEILDYAATYPSRLLVNLSLTFVKIFLVMCCYYYIFAAFGYTLPLWKTGISSIASGIVAYLPISIQGIGTVESAAVWIFGRLEIGAADVLSGFLLLRASGYILAGIISLLMCAIKAEGKSLERS